MDSTVQNTVELDVSAVTSSAPTDPVLNLEPVAGNQADTVASEADRKDSLVQESSLESDGAENEEQLEGPLHVPKTEQSSERLIAFKQTPKREHEPYQYEKDGSSEVSLQRHISGTTDTKQKAVSTDNFQDCEISSAILASDLQPFNSQSEETAFRAKSSEKCSSDVVKEDCETAGGSLFHDAAMQKVHTENLNQHLRKTDKNEVCIPTATCKLSLQSSGDHFNSDYATGTSSCELSSVIGEDKPSPLAVGKYNRGNSSSVCEFIFYHSTAGECKSHDPVLTEDSKPHAQLITAGCKLYSLPVVSESKNCDPVLSDNKESKQLSALNEPSALSDPLINEALGLSDGKSNEPSLSEDLVNETSTLNDGKSNEPSLNEDLVTETSTLNDSKSNEPSLNEDLVNETSTLNDGKSNELSLNEDLVTETSTLNDGKPNEPSLNEDLVNETLTLNDGKSNELSLNEDLLNEMLTLNDGKSNEPSVLGDGNVKETTTLHDAPKELSALNDDKSKESPALSDIGPKTMTPTDTMQRNAVADAKLKEPPTLDYNLEKPSTESDGRPKDVPGSGVFKSSDSGQASHEPSGASESSDSLDCDNSVSEHVAIPKHDHFSQETHEMASCDSSGSGHNTAEELLTKLSPVGDVPNNQLGSDFLGTECLDSASLPDGYGGSTSRERPSFQDDFDGNVKIEARGILKTNEQDSSPPRRSGLHSTRKRVDSKACPGFVWEEYLEETQTEAAPQTAFVHVEKSLENGLKDGQFVEIASRVEDLACSYWVAHVVSSSNTVCRVQYIGDGKAPDNPPFEINKSRTRPLGWCAASGIPLHIPQPVLIKIWQNQEMLRKAKNFIERMHGLGLPLPECPVQSSDETSEGQLVEVIQDQEHCLQTYWLGQIVSSCGPLLRIRYLSGDQERVEFWRQVSDTSLHPMGWAKENGVPLCPPSDLMDLLTNSQEGHLSTSTLVHQENAMMTSVPAAALEGEEMSMFGKIKEGMLVEVLKTDEVKSGWFAKVEKNIGGRLLLRSCTPSGGGITWWMFYLNPLLRHPGWISCNAPWRYSHPKTEAGDVDWGAFEETIKGEAKLHSPPDFLFQDHQLPRVHDFHLGMLLEAVHPKEPHTIHLVKVSKNIDDIFFELTLSVDDSEPICWTTSIEDPLIFPVGFCKAHGIDLKLPANFASVEECVNSLANNQASEKSFSSHLTLEQLEFHVGQRLEAVNSYREDEICVSTIVDMRGPLLWIQLDSDSEVRPIIRSVDSMEIFPVGWYEVNDCPLMLPESYQPLLKNGGSKLETCPDKSTKDCVPQNYSRVMEDETEKNTTTGSQSQPSMWCPCLYINHWCFSGPFLSNGKVAKQTQSVGPGPVELVMREVVCRTISAAYIPTKVLRELQYVPPRNSTWVATPMKAKFKQHIFKRSVHIPTIFSDVEHFLHLLSKTLQCCSNLWSFSQTGESCPLQCNTQSLPAGSLYCGNLRGRGSRGGFSARFLNHRRKKGGRKRLFVPLRTNRYYSGKDIEGGEYLAERGDEEYEDLELDDGDYVDDGGSGSEGDGSVRGSRPGSPLDASPKGCRKQSRFFPRMEMSTQVARMSAFGMKDQPFKRRIEGDGSNNMVDEFGNYKNKKGRYDGAQQFSMGLQPAVLDSNPLEWSINDVEKYVSSQPAISHHAVRLKEQEVDGHALLLLNLPTLVHHFSLPHSSAVVLAQHICRVKLAHCLYFSPG